MKKYPCTIPEQGKSQKHHFYVMYFRTQTFYFNIKRGRDKNIDTYPLLDGH